MPALRVFVSSTCIDLGSHREQIRALLMRMGYDPIMSDYSDVLYDPAKHTHTSCIAEVQNADMVVLLIGSRFGGTAVPEALSELDAGAISSKLTGDVSAGDEAKYSTTQLEALRAIEIGIPIFTFVDAKVYADHHTYTKNKDMDFSDRISYASIQKPETAKYIFEFITFVTHLSSNNALTSYSNFGEIEAHLIKQWSGLFQMLLRDSRAKRADGRKADAIIEQIQDLKAAMLQTISAGSARDVARAVIRYRRLADFVIAMRHYAPSLDIADYQRSFNDLLTDFGVVEVTQAVEGSSSGFPRTVLILNDDTYLRVRVPDRRFEAFAVEWAEFSQLEKETKVAVLQGVSDAGLPTLGIVQHYGRPFQPEQAQTDALMDEVAEVLPSDGVSGWTDTRLKILSTMWSDGKTASQIAEELGGVSRNAVIGKAHRLGLKSRPAPINVNNSLLGD
ncbi:MAG: DUF4062 domain-containing protein [Sphingomonas sp.]|nr:DUF4062 domain-containing protein [Sphingomonas sp.]